MAVVLVVAAVDGQDGYLLFVFLGLIFARSVGTAGVKGLGLFPI